MAFLLLLLTGASCSTGGAEVGPARSGQAPLEDHLAEAPPGFRFSYQARGTDVLDCVLPTRDFKGSVFAGGALSVTVETPSGDAQALSLHDAVYLEGGLFARGSVDAAWIRLQRSGLAAARPALDRVLGVDLAAYIAAPGPPPSGNEVVAAALARTAVDSRLDPIQLRNGAAAAGYRFVVDGDPPVPVIDAWVDGEGVVVRIQVQDSLADQPGKPDPDTGWITDYGPLPRDATAPPQPDGFVEATAGLLAKLAPPRPDGCELEIGPAATASRPQP